MAEHIEEIVKTGSPHALKELRKTLPAGLDELLEIEGLGPKRTKQLYDQLRISSIKKLEHAIDSGKLESLAGFGKKSAEKIRQSIRDLGKRAKRFKLLDADQLVRPLIEYLRKNRGEIQAAQKYKLPDLIVAGDIRGDLHMHSKWTDGNNIILEMVRACKERGYQYCAITDHSKAVRIAGGLNPAHFNKQREEIDEAREKVRGITVFTGCEVDILPDGSLDLPDDLLEQLDVVVAAVHFKMDMNQREMTKRVLKALANPAVKILAHPTGRLINQRQPSAIDLEQIFHAAKEHNVAVELNAQPDRLDLNDLHLLRAKEIGVKIAINTDAHSAEQLHFIRYGIDQARRGWLEKRHVINALALPQFNKWLNQRRRKSEEVAAIRRNG